MDERSSIADILYGSYIRYERMYSMTRFAFHGRTIIDSPYVNVFIDMYSILRTLYRRGLNFTIAESYVIASCFINMAIHIRAFFSTRYKLDTKVYIIYGGARPLDAMVNYGYYNSKNIMMEDSNAILQNLVKDNLEVMSILCPYLYDIFCAIDYRQEFSSLVGAIIDSSEYKVPNIVYSKDPMAYQLVAFEPYTFMFRPRKRLNEETSFVVTKSTLYDAYRYGELHIKMERDTKLHPELFSMYLAFTGVRSRSMNSLKNANSAIKLLEKAVDDLIIVNGYNPSWSYQNPNPFERMLIDSKIDPILVSNRFASLDFPFQKMVYMNSPLAIEMLNSIHQNLYDPQEIRNINDRYFQRYPLDLNRV